VLGRYSESSKSMFERLDVSGGYGPDVSLRPVQHKEHFDTLRVTGASGALEFYCIGG